jgi:hypothetical protein
MSMIFEFRLMEKAEAFVRETKKRYGLNGQAFDDGDEASKHTPFPWVLYPPVALIDRVWPYGCSEAEIEELTRRFGLTRPMLDKVGAGWPDGLISTDCRVAIAAERKIEALAHRFGGTWVGT